MSKRVSFHELAEIELNDAAIFFENEKEGLGLRFLAAMQAAITHIQEHPQASPIIIEDVRRKVLRRFPYNVIFSIKPDRIRILAIASQKRRPFYWRGRE
jgi:ParE toxin of type II toxin-antitoxin system, parDE